MLLRAYVIRLADGLVTLRDQLSVVVDIHRRHSSLFAVAKVYKNQDLDFQPYIR